MDFIQDAVQCRTRVLVHCVAGVSRSVTMVVAWLMREHHMTLLQAVKHCRAVKATVAPNDSFKLALAKYELALVGTTSVAATSDPFWNFYAWNRVKHGHPKAAPGRRPGGGVNSGRGGRGGRGRGKGGAGGSLVLVRRGGGGLCGGGGCAVC